MPLSVLASLATIKTQALSFLRVRFQNAGTSDAQFVGKMANVLGMSLFGLQRTAEQIDRDSPPNNKSSTLGLDKWAETIGVPKNTGGYGRNAATPATGGLAPITGTPGTVVLDGQFLTGPDGVTVFKLVGTKVIPDTGNFSAVTPGSVGNVGAGTTLTWNSPPAGCDGFVILSSATGGGLDTEANDALLFRILSRWQAPPKGGANVDYKLYWAEQQAGVFRAYVYPRRQGTGTVDVVIVSAGSGAGRIPSTTIRDLVAAYIASVQPTNIEQANVLLPLQPAGSDLTVRARAILASKYSWDWNDTTAAWSVAGYNAVTPSITLNAAAHASLISAVANGLKPRLQVLNSNALAPVIPAQPRVIAIDGTNTILTLDGPLVAAPVNGDPIFAGSYAAPIVAQAMLDYIDQVGPSKVSGYADTVNDWDDVVSIFKLGEAADTTDTDGQTKLINRIIVGGLTIAVGVGAPAAADYEPNDGVAGAAPELARAKRVYATQ